MPPTSACGFALKAQWLFPVAAPPLAGGVIAIHNQRIVAVGQNLSGQPPRDLGDVAILPGLVNAHTHLEFSDLEQPLGESGMAFPDWIREVIAWRRRREETEDAGRSRRERAIQLGLRESMTSGVTTLGEIASPGWPEAPFDAETPDCTIFQELLGLAPERREPLLALARSHLTAGKQSHAWRPALSPHAPYTAPLELVEAAAELSQRERVPLAMHLAESREEIELLQSGRGPFYEFLAELSPDMPGLVPRGLRPLDYLARLAAADRALLIHGNYLNDEEISFLAERSAAMSVVYCPRTHDYFRHEHYPLEAMLSRGVRVALGTDSRASNPDLSLWEEMRFVAHRFPAVSPATVLRLGTHAGAEALGVDDECGTLSVGKRADLAIVQLPPRRADDPHALLFDEASRIASF